MSKEDAIKNIAKTYASELYDAYSQDLNQRIIATNKSLPDSIRRRSFSDASAFRHKCKEIFHLIDSTKYYDTDEYLSHQDKILIWTHVFKCLFPSVILEAQGFQKRAASRVASTPPTASDDVFLDLFDSMVQSTKPERR